MGVGCDEGIGFRVVDNFCRAYGNCGIPDCEVVGFGCEFEVDDTEADVDAIVRGEEHEPGEGRDHSKDHVWG